MCVYILLYIYFCFWTRRCIINITYLLKISYQGPIWSRTKLETKITYLWFTIYSTRCWLIHQGLYTTKVWMEGNPSEINWNIFIQRSKIARKTLQTTKPNCFKFSTTQGLWVIKKEGGLRIYLFKVEDQKNWWGLGFALSAVFVRERNKVWRFDLLPSRIYIAVLCVT